MKKLSVLAVAALAVALFVALPAQAVNYTFTYRNGATSCALNATDNAYDLTGKSVEIVYLPQQAGRFETNHAGANCLADGSAAKYPNAIGDASVNDDAGAAGCRGATACGSLVSSGNLATPDPAGAGLQLVAASVWTSDTAGTNAWTGAESKTQADTHLSVIYAGIQLTDAATATFQNVALGSAASLTFRQLHPAQAGSYKVTSTPPAVEGLHTAFVRLQFPSTIMPGPITVVAGTTNWAAISSATVKRGVRIYRSTNNPATTTAADFSLVTNSVIGAPNATVRWDGVTPNNRYMGKAVAVGGDSYFNDFANDANLNANSNYIAVPVLMADTLTTNGIPILMGGGSWFAVGQNSPGAGGLPTPVRVTSFESSFDPKTGKVTLNWKTSTEDDLSGFNIWRDTTANGKPLGQRTFVAFVDAKTGRANVGADYSFVDTVDMSKYQRIARGKPISVAYTIEEVSLSGNVTPAGTTNFMMSPKLAGTAR